MVDQYALTLPYLVDNDDAMSTKLPDKDLLVKIFIFFIIIAFIIRITVITFINHYHICLLINFDHYVHNFIFYFYFIFHLIFVNNHVAPS